MKKKQQLTYKSKDVWDEILHYSLPIESHNLMISKDYTLRLLREAIASGLITTATRYWCNLYWFRHIFPMYMDECTFANLLYRADVPVYYEIHKLCDNRKFKFYAKIESPDNGKLCTFISNRLDWYVDEWYQSYKERDYRKLYNIGGEKGLSFIGGSQQ